MVTIVRDVYLRGSLGENFGRHHRLAVNTPAEALRAVEANRPGFLSHIADLARGGIDFACWIGSENIKASALSMPLGSEYFEISPVIALAGDNGGVIEVILGVLLIAASVVLGPLGASSGIAVLGGAGTISLGTFGGFLGAGTAFWIGLTGASLLLTGISTLLTPKPAFDVNQDERDKSRPSAFFSGPVNTVAQGQPIPVLMGEMHCGSATVALSLENEDRTADGINVA